MGSFLIAFDYANTSPNPVAVLTVEIVLSMWLVSSPRYFFYCDNYNNTYLYVFNIVVSFNSVNFLPFFSFSMEIINWLLSGSPQSCKLSIFHVKSGLVISSLHNTRARLLFIPRANYGRLQPYAQIYPETYSVSTLSLSGDMHYNLLLLACLTVTSLCVYIMALGATIIFTKNRPIYHSSVCCTVSISKVTEQASDARMCLPSLPIHLSNARVLALSENLLTLTLSPARLICYSFPISTHLRVTVSSNSFCNAT